MAHHPQSWVRTHTPASFFDFSGYHHEGTIQTMRMLLSKDTFNR
jgi:hypothetical protein